MSAAPTDLERPMSRLQPGPLALLTRARDERRARRALGLPQGH